VPPKNVGQRMLGRLDMHYMPVGGAATLELVGTVHRTANTPVYVRVTDAKGRLMLETTLLYGSKRPKATVTLDPAKRPAPFRVYAAGVCLMKWTGDAKRVVIARKADMARKLAVLLDAK